MAAGGSTSGRLDRDQILVTALSIVDADGVGALTLRRLASRLDVTAMAMYRHVTDKDDLLDALVERLLGEIDIDASDGADLPSLVSAILRVLRKHPALAEIVPARSMRTEPGLKLAERAVELLRSLGHPPATAAWLSIFLLDASIGLVLRQPGELAVADPHARQEMLEEKKRRLASLSDAQYPNLIATADHFLEPPDQEEYFRHGIAVLLNAVGHPESAAHAGAPPKALKQPRKGRSPRTAG